MAKAEIIQDEQGWKLQLDGKPLHTPRRAPLALPTETLANALAAEWRNTKKFTPSAMPMNAIAYTAVDVMSEHAQRMVEAMLAFADTDLLIYRSETPGLRARQDAGWNPIIAWLGEYAGVEPTVTEGVMPINQPPELLAALRDELSGYTPFVMAAFSVLTQNLGSLFLALAVKERRLAAAHAFTLSRIDEDYQSEQWGEDSVTIGRAREIERDVVAAAAFLECL